MDFDPETVSVTSGRDPGGETRSWNAPTSLYWCTPAREGLLLALSRSKCSRLTISTTLMRRGMVAVDALALGRVPGGGRV